MATRKKASRSKPATEVAGARKASSTKRKLPTKTKVSAGVAEKEDKVGTSGVSSRRPTTSGAKPSTKAARKGAGPGIGARRTPTKAKKATTKKAKASKGTLASKRKLGAKKKKAAAKRVSASRKGLIKEKPTKSNASSKKAPAKNAASAKSSSSKKSPPRKKRVAGAKPRRGAAVPPPDYVDRSDIRVLVVDDEPEIIELILPVLKERGYTVFEAENGDEAIETILVEQPQVVVLDVMMPGMSGWEVCKYVRSRPELDDVRIIMATGIGEETNAATSPLYGADDSIDKPFRLEALAKKVDVLVARIQKGTL